jgi:hypothetical protein
MLWQSSMMDGVRLAMAVLPGQHQGLFVVANDDLDAADAGAMELVNSVFHPVPAIDPSGHPRFVVDRLPAEATSADTLFGDFARFVAWAAPTEVHRGETARVRLYFKVLKTPDVDWEIFTDVDHGGPGRQHANHYPGTGSDSTRFWKAGEIVVDDFVIRIPSDVKPGEARVCFNFSALYARAAIAPEPKDDVRLCGPRLAVIAQ